MYEIIMYKSKTVLCRSPGSYCIKQIIPYELVPPNPFWVRLYQVRATHCDCPMVLFQMKFISSELLVYTKPQPQSKKEMF